MNNYELILIIFVLIIVFILVAYYTVYLYFENRKLINKETRRLAKKVAGKIVDYRILKKNTENIRQQPSQKEVENKIEYAKSKRKPFKK